MKKRLLAFLMVLALLIACVPSGVFAEGTAATEPDAGLEPQAETTEETIEETTEAATAPVVIPEPHSHSAQQHTCEDCQDANVEWKAWTGTTTLPTTTGHYYLTGNVTTAKRQDVTGTNQVVLCLNGYTVDGSAASTIYQVKDTTSSLVISDCTAYTDAEGNYVAGALTNGKNKDVGGAIYVTEGVFKMFGGKLTGHENTQAASNVGWSGGAIQARNSAKVTLKNVEISNNKTSADGGAICLRNNAQLTMENVTFKNNQAGGSGGAIYMATKTTKLTATGCTFEGNDALGTNGGAICTIAGATGITLTDCVFKENTAANRGGAIYVDNSTITVTGGEMTDNTAVGGGAVHAYKGNTTLEGVTVTGNKATDVGGSAIYVNGGSAKLALKDCTVTGNQSTGTKTSNRGGIYMTNNSDKLTVSGATVVDDNMIAVDGTPKEVNILLQNKNASMNVDGLTDGAKISVLTHAGAVEEVNFLSFVNEPTVWNKLWVVYENNGMAVDYDLTTKQFSMVANTDHVHCACGEHNATEEAHEHVATETCDHSEIAYVAWESTNSLPKDPGNYYLTADVVVSKETAVSTNSGIPDVINLCLNGHTIRVDYETEGKVNDQIFYITLTADLTISDCTAHVDTEGNYVAGQLTGGTYGVITLGDTSNKAPAATLTIYDGIITGNSYSGSGGAINMKTGTSTLNIYGGQITGNTAGGSGSAVYVGEGNTFNMYGGEITGNTAGGSGAVYIHAAAAAVNIAGDSIITGNTAGAAASNLYLAGETQVTLGEMGEKTNIGVSADIAKDPRQITSTAGTGAGLVSDSQYRPLQLQEGIVYMTFSKDHAHCPCDAGISGCDHVITAWVPWESTSALPTGSGYYYLTADVTMTEAALINKDAEVFLCLNGHTVTAAKNQRIMTIQLGAEVTITDCAEQPGSLTGGARTYGGAININRTATLNLFAGKLTGNAGMANADGVGSEGGAIYMQKGNETEGGGTFNMYGGEISGNTAVQGGAIRACGGVQGGVATTVNLYGGKITGNTSTEEGGAIHAAAYANINLSGTEIEGNKAGTSAGAIYATAAKLTMTGGTISKNEAATNGGGVLITASAGVMTMTDGEISGNTAGNAAGGVLVQSRATLDLQGGKISGNTAGSDGAGVYVSTNSSMTMSGGEISGNTAKGYAGGINVLGGTFTMTGGQVSGNTAKNGAGITARLGERTVDGKKVRDVAATLTIKDGKITGNTATSTGGGMLLNGNGVLCNMEGGEISGNTAPNGGGVITQTVSVFNLKGGKITGNTAPKGGAGIYVSYTSTFNMDGGEISKNKTEANGGGMYVLGGVVTLKGGKFSGNSAKSSGGAVYATNYIRKATETTEEITYTPELNLKGVTISGNTTEGNGGGICTSKGAVVNLDSGSITGNTAAKNAGGILLQSKSVLNMKGGSVSYNTAVNNSTGGVYVSSDSFINMYGGTISSNTSGGSGAGMYLLRCEAVLAGGTISNNSTPKNGGGIYIAGAKVKLSGTNIQGNTSEGNGGGICTTGSSVTKNGVKTTYYPDITMTAGTISGNTTTNGAGILLQSKTVMNMSGGVIEGNKATKSGGGLYASTNSTFNMSGGTIQNNESGMTGAGLYHLRSTGTHTGGTIKGNIATTNAGGMMVSGAEAVVTVKDGFVITENSGASGGGVVVQSKATLNVEGGEFTKNTSSKSGGGLYLSTNSFMNISGGLITENTAGVNGGGVYQGSNSFLTISGGEIINNTAEGSGGGVYSTTLSDATMTGGVISGNKAAIDGGAIGARGNFRISGVEITNNTAGENGGAIATDKRGSTNVQLMSQDALVLENVTLRDNTSGKQGGAIYLRRGSKGTLRDVVITGNTAGTEGGGIYADDDLTMHNVSITGNTSGGEGYALYLTPAEYDGESYFVAVYKISGEIKVCDNEGKDLYIGEQTTMSIGKDGLTGDSKIDLTLHSGYLTNTLYGAYNYEGGNQEYVVTAGDRSLTDPEYDAAYNDLFKNEEPVEDPSDATEPVEGNENQGGNSIVYIVIGAFVVVIAAVLAILLAAKKKKSGAKAEKATKE